MIDDRTEKILQNIRDVGECLKTALKCIEELRLAFEIMNIATEPQNTLGCLTCAGTHNLSKKCLTEATTKVDSIIKILKEKV